MNPIREEVEKLPRLARPTTQRDVYVYDAIDAHDVLSILDRYKLVADYAFEGTGLLAFWDEEEIAGILEEFSAGDRIFIFKEKKEE